MPSRPVAGFAFQMHTEVGLAVGVVSHDRPKIGSLVWIAKPLFVTAPSPHDVQEIREWRWPVFFPLAAALRRRLVEGVGLVELPLELRDFPVLRSGNRSAGWQAFTEEADGVRRDLGSATDPKVPIYSVVNDTRLREMIECDWRPDNIW